MEWTAACDSCRGHLKSGRCRLSGSAEIAGIRMYVEAVAVRERDGQQVAVCPDGASRLDGLGVEFATARFGTVKIGRLDYFIVAIS